MSFLSGNELENILKLVLGDTFDSKRISQAAYELSLGDQVYRTDSPSKKREILTTTDSQIIINPGQFALLITEETIKMPNNFLAFISIKFNQKIKGLVNVSGFHIDPNFEGKIIFSVYNAGPSAIIMDKGKPYFLIWFSSITESVNYNGKHQGQNEISAELIEQLKGDLASPNALLMQIKDLEDRLTKKTDELSGKKNYLTWLYQALLIVFAGLFINECRKNDQIAQAYQNGSRDTKEKAVLLKEMKIYFDSIQKEQDPIKEVKVQTPDVSKKKSL